MNPLLWIRTAIPGLGFEIPIQLDAIINRGLKEQSPFYFVPEASCQANTERMNSLFPSHRVFIFGRRLDYDGVICLVVADGAYPKGSVLVLHWDGWPGTEIDEEYPSLAAWAKSAEEEIAARLDDE